MVLLGLPFIEVESTAVEKDSGFDVLGIAKTACSSSDGYTLAIDACGDRIGDRVSTVGYDVGDWLFRV